MFLLAGCGLRYTPQITPEDAQTIRRNQIEKTLTDDFAQQHKTYQPVAYSESVKIKPKSYQKLDSLFEQKYQLERIGKTDSQLEEQIKIQQIICQNDTNQVLIMERHIFTLEGDSVAEILSGDFYFDKQNQLKDVKFTESNHIDKDYVNYYPLYIFEEPFLGGSELTTDEKEFYSQYKTEINRRLDKDAFLNLTLQLMQIAYYKRSLNTETLLKELTRKIVHEGKSNYNDEVFLTIEQVAENHELTNYHVVYQSVTKKETGTFTNRYSLNFDPYLMFMNKEEIPIQ